MATRRDELEALTKETLIEHVLLLEGRLQTLEKQVRELQAVVATPKPLGKAVGKTAANSSLPPGQSQKGQVRRRVKRKRGPKHGHVGASHRNLPPDEVVECRVTRCAGCGAALADLEQTCVGSRQQIDLAPLQQVVREARCYALCCPSCGQTQQAAYPAEFASHSCFGPRLTQAVVYLHYAHPLSYQRVQHILRDVFGASVSLGALVNLVQRQTPRLHQAAEIIRQHLQRAPVIGSDETRARVDGQTWWQWVFQTPRWVYMRMDRRRSRDVIKAVLGRATPEVWVSDLGAMQITDNPAQTRQVCLAHQVRDLQYAIDAHRCPWAYRLQSLFYQAMRLGKQRAVLTDDHYQQQVRQLEQQLDTLLAQYPDNDDSRRLLQRFRKHRASLLVFLYRSDVPPTNNASEQALRNSVIYRKVTGGFRTLRGAHRYAHIVSILESARRQQRTFIDLLSALLIPPPVLLPQRE